MHSHILNLFLAYRMQANTLFSLGGHNLER